MSFGKGAYPKGSNVASSRTVIVPTTMVSVPANKYGQSGGKKRKKRK